MPGALAASGAVPTRYKLIAVTFSLSMLLYIDRVAISTARNPVSEAFGLSDTQFGWVLSAFALGYALFQTPAGALADRYGARLVLAFVVGLWSVFTALTGIAWSFASLLLFRFLFGAAEAGAYPTCARAFYAWLPAGERGLAQGINFSGSRLGAAFALPAVAWLVVMAGWRLAFIILGALGVVWAAAWYAWFRNTPDEHQGVSDVERQLIRQGRPEAASARAAPLRRASADALGQHAARDGAVLRIELHVLLLSDVAVSAPSANLSTRSAADRIARRAAARGRRDRQLGRWCDRRFAVSTRPVARVPSVHGDCGIRALRDRTPGEPRVSKSAAGGVVSDPCDVGVRYDASAFVGVLHRYRPGECGNGIGHHEHGRATSGHSSRVWPFRICSR